MSEKRFKKMDTIIDPFPIWDTVEEKGYNCTDTLDLLVDLLNELSDENKKLRFLIDINSVSERKKLERQVDEQQAIINEQNEAIDYLKTVIKYTLPNQMVADVFKQIGEEYE